MNENTRNFMVGLTTIGALIGMSLLLLLFGELDRYVHPRYAMYVDLNDAGGVRPGSQVELNGVPIGVVEQVNLRDRADLPIEARLRIDQGVQVPETAEPHIVAPLIGGSAILRLEYTSQPDIPTRYLAHDGSGRLSGHYETPVETLTRELDVRMKPIIESLGRIDTLADTYQDLGEHLVELVRAQSPDELAAGDAANIHTAVQRLNRAIDESHATMVMAQRWLGDDELRGSAHDVVTRASDMLDNATATLDSYDRLARSLEEDTDQLTGRLLPAIDQLDETLTDIRTVMGKIDRGEGTIGQLVNNPDLYRSLDDAAHRLERVLVEVQLMVEKVRAEGVSINLWGRGG